jgi:hypothetical protein
MRRKLGVKGRKEFERLFRACVDGFLRAERRTRGKVAFHRGGRIDGGEDREAGNEWARLAGRGVEVLRGKMEPSQRSAG